MNTNNFTQTGNLVFNVSALKIKRSFNIFDRDTMKLYFNLFVCFMANNDLMRASSFEVKDVKWAATVLCPILLPDCGVLLWVIFFLTTMASPLHLTLIETDSKSQLPINDTLEMV